MNACEFIAKGGTLMSTAYWCILIAMIFPYFFVVLSRTSQSVADIPIQRKFFEKLTGWKLRSYWIHLNSFEIFPPFAISVVIAHQLHATQSLLDILAITFVILRIVYAICYLYNTALLRTFVFGLGLICVVVIFLSPLI